MAEDALNVTVDALFARIGRMTVEAEILRRQLADKTAALAAADAELSRLRGEQPTNRLNGVPVG